MTPRKGKQFRTFEHAEPAASFVLQHAHAAGVDVHSDVHFVAVPPDEVPEGFINPDPKLPRGVRKFGANTGDLEALASWLKECQVTTVAMEATGVYWIPLFELLERQGFRRDSGRSAADQARPGPAQERCARLPVDSPAAQLRSAHGVVPSKR